MSDQHQPSIVEEVRPIPVQDSIDQILSQLKLHQESMDTAPSDAEHRQSSVTAPSPTRNTTPLKRRSPSPAFSPPLQQSDAGFHRQMLSEGYTAVLPLADNERSFQTIAPITRGCNTLSSSTGNNNTPAGIPKSEVDAFVENLNRRSLLPSGSSGSGTAGLPSPHPLLLSSLMTPILTPTTSRVIPSSEVAAFVENRSRRSLFPSPATGSSGAASLPPPHPLTRTIDDPVLFSTPIHVIPNSEVAANRTRRSLLPSSSGTAGLPPPHLLTRTTCDPGLLSTPILPPRSSPGIPKSEVAARTDFAQENQSSSKRLKRVRFNSLLKQLLDEMAVHYDLDEVVEATPETEVTLVDDKVLSCGGGPEEVAGQEVEEEAGDDEVAGPEGTVSVERNVEGVELEIKCKCGSGHSVRIIGHCQHCYYKLI